MVSIHEVYQKLATEYQEPDGCDDWSLQPSGPVNRLWWVNRCIHTSKTFSSTQTEESWSFGEVPETRDRKPPRARSDHRSSQTAIAKFETPWCDLGPAARWCKFQHRTRSSRVGIERAGCGNIYRSYTDLDSLADMMCSASEMIPISTRFTYRGLL